MNSGTHITIFLPLIDPYINNDTHAVIPAQAGIQW